MSFFSFFFTFFLQNQSLEEKFFLERWKNEQNEMKKNPFFQIQVSISGRKNGQQKDEAVETERQAQQVGCFICSST